MTLWRMDAVRGASNSIVSQGAARLFESSFSPIEAKFVVRVRPNRVAESEEGWLVQLHPGRGGQAFGCEELRIEKLALIPCPTVAKDRHDGFSWTQVVGEADRSGHIDPRRAPDAKPFLLQEVKCNRQPLDIGNAIGGVDLHAFDVLCDSALTNPFADTASRTRQLALGVVAVNGRAFGVC